MLSTPKFIEYLTERDYGPFVGVPCSFLKPFINYVIENKDLEYIAANNEGEGIAIAAGAYLAGRKPVVMFQNSGLGNTVNPLTSLTYVFRIPLLLITTWRGEARLRDAPQHVLMGEITSSLLDVLRVRHDMFPEEDDELEAKVNKAIDYLEGQSLPYALIMRKGVVTPYELVGSSRDSTSHAPGGRLVALEPPAKDLMLRSEAVVRIADAVGPEAAIVATTGKTARELFALRDRPANFYVVGSMGCASSLALGVALNRPDRRVVVLDGDGAALMRLEALVSIGYYRPANFLHIIMDNEAYESTGGQRTLSGGVDFTRLALACGYRTTASVSTEPGLRQVLEVVAAGQGPHLVHVRIQSGSDPNLGRPTLAPPEQARRFREAILRRG